jgi:hypothetical protein
VTKLRFLAILPWSVFWHYQSNRLLVMLLVLNFNKRTPFDYFCSSRMINLRHTLIHIGKRLSDPATRYGGAWGERRYSSYSFLTSTLDGGEWSASRPGRALPRGKNSGTHCTGGWVGRPRAGLDAEARRKIPVSVGDRTPVVQSVVRHYTAWAIPAPQTHGPMCIKRVLYNALQ